MMPQLYLLDGDSMKKLILFLAFAFFLASCETVKGVGRDIESIAEDVDDAT